MSSSELAALGTTFIRLSVFMLYALVGVVSWRWLLPRLSGTASRLAGIFLVGQVFVIAMALREQPASLFERWLWDVHEEGNVAATLASAQLALVAGVALITAWLAGARPAWERAYYLALAAIFVFVARDEYISLHEQIANWERYYIGLGLAVAAATGALAARSPRAFRGWHICLLIGLAMSAAGAIAFEANPLFCGRWDFLPLEGCVWAAHYEETLEFLGIWLVLVALLGQLSSMAPAAGRGIRIALYALTPLWVGLLFLDVFLPRLELTLLAQPANVQFESGPRLQGFRVWVSEHSAGIWLYTAAQSEEVTGSGYSLELIDLEAGEVYASLIGRAENPVGFLIAPDYHHVYRQRLELALPPEGRSDRALDIALRLWREHEGDYVYDKIVDSDLSLLDETRVGLLPLSGRR